MAALSVAVLTAQGVVMMILRLTRAPESGSTPVMQAATALAMQAAAVPQAVAFLSPSMMVETTARSALLAPPPPF